MNHVSGPGRHRTVMPQIRVLAAQVLRLGFVHPEDARLEGIIRFVAMVSPPCLVQEDNTPARVEEPPRSWARPARA